MRPIIYSLLLLLTPIAAKQPRETPQAVMRRADTDLLGGRITEAVAGFDALAKLVPDEAPYLWQRGIALYYAGRYQDCREQFESHRTVNPADVENAAWHFLCVAHATTPAKARTALLPVGRDPRTPMREVYEMFKGTLKPEQVMAAAGSDAEGLFFAHLYVGLYYDAMGDRTRSLEHITAAGADEYRASGGYMHQIARVHVARQGGQDAAGMKNPVAASADSLAAGEKTYQKHCRSCHGREGGGGMGPNLIDDVWTQGSTDVEIFTSIRNGAGTRMEGWDDRIDETETWNLVNYIRSLAKPK